MDGPRVVLPGDRVALPSEPNLVIKLGPGLRPVDDAQGTHAVVTTCGILRHKAPAQFWVDIASRNPIAAEAEYVLGIVTSHGSETHQVDIGAPSQARLNALAFEGATRRNHPKIQVGDLVYGRLIVANPDMEPEMSCVANSGKANGMGVLEGGLLRECSLSLCRKLRQKESSVLVALGGLKQFEVVVGQNGRFWVKASTALDTIVVANALVASEHMSKKQIRTMVQRIAAH